MRGTAVTTSPASAAMAAGLHSELERGGFYKIGVAAAVVVAAAAAAVFVLLLLSFLLFLFLLLLLLRLL